MKPQMSPPPAPWRLVLLACHAAIAVGCTSPSAPTLPEAPPTTMSTAMPLASHPGTVKMVDMFTHETQALPADAVPPERRFVYFKDGLEISGADGATKAVPIVEVRMFPLDAQGQLVAKDKAARIRVLELGPEGQTLRTTLMLPR